MKAFVRLLWKDLEESKLPILINCGITIVWLLFLRYRLETGWPLEAVAALALLPMGFLPFWFMWQTYQSLRSEWRDDTIYTLLALPVPGWFITLAKMMALLLEYTITAAVWVIGLLAVFWAPFRPELTELFSLLPVTWFLKNGLLIYLATVAIYASFITYVQLAYIVAKIVGRFHGLVLLWVLLLTGWLTSSVGALLQPIFAWMPKVPLDRLFSLHETTKITTSVPHAIYWDVSGSIGSWLAVVGLFFLSAWLLENYVEVN